MPTSTFADALALHWPTFKHSRWGSAETINWRLFGQDSIRILALGLSLKPCWRILGVPTSTPLQTLWYYAGRHLSIPDGVARKLLAGTYLGKIRVGIWLLLEFKAMLADLGCTHKHFRGRSGNTLADI